MNRMLLGFFVLCSISLFGSFLPETSDRHVYHGSPTQDLTTLKPRISTHGKNWVYAFYNPVFAVVFTVRLDDFHVAKGVGFLDGIFYIVERYRGAFEHYRGKEGSIYEVSSNGFLSEQTNWSPEIVCSKEVAVDREIKIANIYELLKQFEAEGRLTLYYYPDRPDSIPKDDSDLIRKAVFWTIEGFPSVGASFLKFHPHLKNQFETTLEEGVAS